MSILRGMRTAAGHATARARTGQVISRAAPVDPSKFRNNTMGRVHGATVARGAAGRIARANPTVASFSSRAKATYRGMSRRKKIAYGVGGMATAAAIKSTGPGSPNQRRSNGIYGY